MTMIEMNTNRKETIKQLDKLCKSAYSGLTCSEYDMIKACREFINLKMINSFREEGEKYDKN